MKRLLTLTTIFFALSIVAWAQEVAKPIYKYSYNKVSSGSTDVLKDAEENELATIYYGKDYERVDKTKDEQGKAITFTFNDVASWGGNSRSLSLAGQSFSNVSGGKGNPVIINDDNETYTSPSLSKAPNAGIYVKVTPTTNAFLTMFIYNVANNKAIYVVGGDNGAKNPTLTYNTKTTDTEEDWAEYENGKTTADVFSATGGTSIAIRFLAKAGVDYYFFVAGSKMNFAGFTYQETDAGNADEARKIAWISSSDDPEGEDLYRMYAPTDGFDYTAINSTTTEITADELRAFDAVVVSTNVSTTDKAYQLLADNIAYVPMINLNTNIFGYEKQETGNTTLTIQAGGADLFESIGYDEEANTFEYVDVAVSLPTLFASDKILAKNGDFTTFHTHAATRNAYMLLASPDDHNVDFETWPILLANALNTVSATKREVTAAATPAITSTYVDKQTTVKIASATGASVVYYSLDNGATYSKYENELTFTSETDVKAYAEAEGYERSAVASASIIIKEQTAKPAIVATNNGDKTTLTITAEEGATVYYSFAKNEDTSKMTLYSEPVVVSAPGTIYAVATISDKLNSQLASKEYTIETLNANTIRLDTLAHFDANQADCYDAVSAACIESFAASGTASAFYYFGKSAWDYYKTNEDGSRIKADSTLIYSDPETYEYIYIPNPEALKTVNFGNGWMLKSYGTVATYENIAAELAVGNGATGRYADSAEDLIGLAPTKGLIDFAGKKEGDPYSMSIESTAKLAGPFDVVTILGNGSTSNMKLEAQVSTDGENWQTIGELNYSTTQRYWRRSKLAYEGTDEVYLRIYGGGSKGQLYDIYVMYNGENSKKYGSSVAGDVNGDGKVTMSDANDIVSYYLASDKSTIANFNLSAANLIEDYDQETGEPIISMADANEVVSIFLGSGK